MWQPKLTSLGPERKWLVHIANMEFDAEHGCWIFAGVFADVVVQGHNLTDHVPHLTIWPTLSISA